MPIRNICFHRLLYFGLYSAENGFSDISCSVPTYHNGHVLEYYLLRKRETDFRTFFDNNITVTMYKDFAVGFH